MDAKECLVILNTAQYLNDCAILPKEIFYQKYGQKYRINEIFTENIIASGPKLLKFVIENIREYQPEQVTEPPALAIPDKSPKEKTTLPAKKRGRPAKIKTVVAKRRGRPAKIKTEAVGKKGQAHSSQYKGVSLWKNGKWRAQVTKKGRNHYLGTFEKELDAAAAVQEFLGNKQEAKRPHKESIDTEAVARTRAAKKKELVASEFFQGGYECTGCGEDYVEKPQKCDKCGGSVFEPLFAGSDE